MNAILKQQKQSPYPITQLELSHSTLDSYHSCPRKLEFRKFYGINTRGHSLAGNGGIALHDATGVYLKTRSHEAATLELMLKYPIDLCSNPLWKWSLEACYSVLLQIIKFLDEHSEFELATILDKPAIEVPFLINIKHDISDFIPVVYRGYMDYVFYNRMENSYLVFDLKNTTSTILDHTPKYRFDTQCLPYALVLQRALGLDFEYLDVNYLVTYVNLMEPRIQLLEFEKTRNDVFEFAQDLYVDLIAMKTYYDTGWFPRRSSACMGYNRQCNHYNICESRKHSTIKEMLKSIEQQEQEPFEPWITLDLELIK